jgi:hypothetical protein
VIVGLGLTNHGLVRPFGITVAILTSDPDNIRRDQIKLDNILLGVQPLARFTQA